VEELEKERGKYDLVINTLFLENEQLYPVWGGRIIIND
jgi:hypothetical protein